jgi:hypothetical protein
MNMQPTKIPITQHRNVVLGALFDFALMNHFPECVA